MRQTRLCSMLDRARVQTKTPAHPRFSGQLTMTRVSMHEPERSCSIKIRSCRCRQGVALLTIDHPCKRNVRNECTSADRPSRISGPQQLGPTTSMHRVFMSTERLWQQQIAARVHDAPSCGFGMTTSACSQPDRCTSVATALQSFLYRRNTGIAPQLAYLLHAWLWSCRMTHALALAQHSAGNALLAAHAKWLAGYACPPHVAGTRRLASSVC